MKKSVIERRYARRQGVLLRWYEVRSYTHRTADGTLKGGKTIKEAKTKKEAAAYCRRHRIEITEERDDMENITEEMAIRPRYELVKAATRKTAGRKQDFAHWLRRLAGKYLIVLLSFVLYSVLLLRGQQAKDLRLYEAERAQLVATHAVELEAKDREDVCRALSAAGVVKMGVTELFALLFILYEFTSILKNMLLCGIPIPAGLRKKAVAWLESMTDETGEEFTKAATAKQVHGNLDAEQLRTWETAELCALARDMGIDCEDPTDREALINLITAEPVTIET